MKKFGNNLESATRVNNLKAELNTWSDATLALWWVRAKLARLLSPSCTLPDAYSDEMLEAVGDYIMAERPSLGNLFAEATEIKDEVQYNCYNLMSHAASKLPSETSDLGYFNRDTNEHLEAITRDSARFELLRDLQKFFANESACREADQD